MLEFSVYLKPGNVIQFVSRASGRSIQIIVSKESNELICDAIGGTGPFFPNAHWLVVCGQHGRYYFHNNYNYLAIKNGKAAIIPSSMNEKPPVESEFRVQDVLGSTQAIYLESVQQPGYFICFDDEGIPGDEIRTKTKDRFAQLEIQLVKFFFEIHRLFENHFRSPMDQVYNQKKMTILSKLPLKLLLHHIGLLQPVLILRHLSKQVIMPLCHQLRNNNLDLQFKHFLFTFFLFNLYDI